MKGKEFGKFEKVETEKEYHRPELRAREREKWGKVVLHLSHIIRIDQSFHVVHLGAEFRKRWYVILAEATDIYPETVRRGVHYHHPRYRRRFLFVILVGKRNISVPIVLAE